MHVIKVILKIIGYALLLSVSVLSVRATYDSGNHGFAYGTGGFYILLLLLPLNDYLKKRKKKVKTFLKNSENFTNAFLQLAALIMRADDKNKDDEYDYVWEFIDSQYSNKRRVKYMVRLETQYLNEAIDYRKFVIPSMIDLMKLREHSYFMS